MRSYFARRHAGYKRSTVEAGISGIIAENGRLDVIVHNAGHMVFGPAEAFTPDQLGGVVRRKLAEYSARDLRSPASVAKAEERSCGLGVEQ